MVRRTVIAAAALVAAALQLGCGSTCERLEKDRKEFLARAGKGEGAHVEVIVPFAVAERLVQAEVAAVKPIALKIPGLGGLGDYFGELTVAPTRVRLRPAAPERIGFRLDFEVRSDGKKAFAMFLDAEVAPEIDPAGGKVALGFTPEALAQARPGIPKDAKKDLGGLIYDRIPGPARLLLPRSVVEAAAGSAVELLVKEFYERAKEKMLPKIAERSRVEIALPAVPLAGVGITSTEEGGGRLRLAIATTLPARAGVAAPAADAPPPSAERITVRLSGSALAELVNWAMAKGLVPDRYDDKGKAKADGELRPGLDWIAGEKKPMRVILWDLDKPCMRITMAAAPVVAIADGKLAIEAKDAETDDVEASAFTKVGVWFYLLWKDAMKLKQKADARMKIAAGGRDLEIAVASAAVERDELRLEVDLQVAPPAPQ